jgi:hypothetical protein
MTPWQYRRTAANKGVGANLAVGGGFFLGVLKNHTPPPPPHKKKLY